MPSYKLYYFNVRGRGELTRLILHCAGVPFEDFRFEGKEWPAIKPSKFNIIVCLSNVSHLKLY